MKIYPYKICGDAILFRKSGKKIRKLIKENWNSGDKFYIYFEGESVDSVSFYDEAFAMLLKEGITIDELQKRLLFPDIQDGDKALLNYVISEQLKKL